MMPACPEPMDRDKKETIMKPRQLTLTAALLAAAVLLAAAGPAAAAPGDKPVAPVPAAKLSEDKAKGRTASIPAKGLFQGDQLTDAAKAKLTDLIIEALGLRVEVALVIPTGPWQIDGSGAGERDLTPARLNAVRKFLTERGIESQRIFVESRVDAKLKEPRLDVQLLGQPAND
jgi:OmpA-OmpF porin, OOP family